MAMTQRRQAVAPSIEAQLAGHLYYRPGYARQRWHGRESDDERVLSVLTKDWQNRSAIRTAARMDTTRSTHALRRLVEMGVAEREAVRLKPGRGRPQTRFRRV